MHTFHTFDFFQKMVADKKNIIQVVLGFFRADKIGEDQGGLLLQRQLCSQTETPP